MTSRILERLARPNVATVLAAALLWLIADRALRLVGGVGPDAAVLDETAHLMTGYLVLVAVFRGAGAVFATGVLTGSVLIDCDHLPAALGTQVLTAGTDRPYTHSLLTVATLAVVAVAVPRVRSFAGGAAVSVAVHFFRDMNETTAHGAGMPLLWPFSAHSYLLHSVAAYDGFVGLCAVVAAARAARHRGRRPVTGETRRQTGQASVAVSSPALQSTSALRAAGR